MGEVELNEFRESTKTAAKVELDNEEVEIDDDKSVAAKVELDDAEEVELDNDKSVAAKVELDDAEEFELEDGPTGIPDENIYMDDNEAVDLDDTEEVEPEDGPTDVPDVNDDFEQYVQEEEELEN